MIQKQQISVFWFRRDLRIADNTALLHALDSKYPVLPIFIFDPNILSKLENKQDPRVQFILNELQQIKSKLEEKGSSLMVYNDSPESAFLSILNQYDVRKVFANRDYEPAAITRDEAINHLLNNQNIDFHLFKDHVILEGNEVLKSDGTPYKVFTPFKRVWLENIKNISPEVNSTINYENFYQQNPQSFPKLAEIGFELSKISIPSRVPDLEVISNYDTQRNFPGLRGTSRLGIHLRFGTVSIRSALKIAFNHNESWLNELIWREFYSAILQHYPYVTKKAFKKKYDLIPWRNNEAEFTRWCNGQTGFPIVDAGMRELNQTGFMHNRVRMITASFLTKHLLIDWRWGEAYFASKLLDFELASNNGGWQWAAGTGTDAQPYFRVFNPDNQTKNFDPNLEYINTWIPELNTLTYPNPMVDHKAARIRAIETYKKAVS